MLFNLAFLHEGTHQLGLANAYYKQILSEQPDYIDAYMRLAHLARKRGDVLRCLHWAEEAEKGRPNAPLDQLCFKGKVLLDMGRLRESAEAFKTVAAKTAPEDTYCFLGLANIAFRNAVMCRSSEQEQYKLLGKAYSKYLDILAHDFRNGFACLGTANVLAYFNQIQDA